MAHRNRWFSQLETSIYGRDFPVRYVSHNQMVSHGGMASFLEKWQTILRIYIVITIMYITILWFITIITIFFLVSPSYPLAESHESSHRFSGMIFIPWLQLWPGPKILSSQDFVDEIGTITVSSSLFHLNKYHHDFDCY